MKAFNQHKFVFSLNAFILQSYAILYYAMYIYIYIYIYIYDYILHFLSILVCAIFEFMHKSNVQYVTNICVVHFKPLLNLYISSFFGLLDMLITSANIGIY